VKGNRNKSLSAKVYAESLKRHGMETAERLAKAKKARAEKAPADKDAVLASLETAVSTTVPKALAPPETNVVIAKRPVGRPSKKRQNTNA
jgi:hypothetical protein